MTSRRTREKIPKEIGFVLAGGVNKLMKDHCDLNRFLYQRMIHIF